MRPAGGGSAGGPDRRVSEGRAAITNGREKYRGKCIRVTPIIAERMSWPAASAAMASSRAKQDAALVVPGVPEVLPRHVYAYFDNDVKDTAPLNALSMITYLTQLGELKERIFTDMPAIAAEPKARAAKTKTVKKKVKKAAAKKTAAKKTARKKGGSALSVVICSQ